ncbi:guanine nucleotide binding protein, alpha subunit, partial [Ganoderma leucocontextum]
FSPQEVESYRQLIFINLTRGLKCVIDSMKDMGMLVVDVGGQRSERRKWIHCFQDVTSVVFVVSLSGYDQCLIEDKYANQMIDAMTVWEAVCRAQCFERISIILFLNKNDVFERKVQTSHIKDFFPESLDYNGEKGDAEAGREYFKKRFARLAQKDNAKGRESYIYVTTATDTAAFRGVMTSVEGAS